MVSSSSSKRGVDLVKGLDQRRNPTPVQSVTKAFEYFELRSRVRCVQPLPLEAQELRLEHGYPVEQRRGRRGDQAGVRQRRHERCTRYQGSTRLSGIGASLDVGPELLWFRFAPVRILVETIEAS